MFYYEECKFLIIDNKKFFLSIGIFTKIRKNFSIS